VRPPSPGAQSRRTALSFEVADIRGEIRELERRGVSFADYDLPGPEDGRPHRGAGQREGGVVQ
jgi:hypothetical protein